MATACRRRTALLGIALLASLLPACATTPVRPDVPAPQPASASDADAEERSFGDKLKDDLQLSLADHARYYSPAVLGAMALGIGAAAPMANGSADEDIRRWYQTRIHRDELNGVSTAAGIAGQVWVVLPVGMELARLLGPADEETLHDGGLFEWSNRSLRSMAVGYPPVLAMFGLLGASRPDKGDSRWRPFEDLHGVSGHTFVGAVPFLTAAAMTDSPWLKAPLVVGSLLTGWSRLHDDRHYASQVLLGWWMAALSVWSVDQTQKALPWTLAPTVGPDGAGLALEMRY
jgi:hypothetical protein